MARTFITCEKCGGPVVLDLSGGMKLVAPSFALTPEGIKNLVIDVHKCNDKPAPQFVCVSCHTEYGEQEIKNCKSVCALCQEDKPISEMNSTSYITPICNECVDAAKKGENTTISDLFTAPPNFRVTKLVTALFKTLPKI